MKIVLFRHGEPLDLAKEPISANDLGLWIAQYDSGSIKAESNPTKLALAIASESKLLISSDLRRSRDSADRLSTGQSVRQNALFKEAGLPYSNHKTLKLTPQIWIVVFRVLWYLGYAKGSESRTAVKVRAAIAAKELISLAREHQNIVLVGHGIFNRFIARELLRQDFKGPSKPSSKYWGYAVYESD